MSDNFVPNFEERYYEVHPAQLRWAMHQLDSVPGYNVRGYAQGRGGMYIIVVQAPIGAEQADWRAPQPQRRRWRGWRIDGRQVLAWLCVLVIVGGLGYMGYTMATGGALPTWGDVTAQLPAMPWSTPAAPHGEPVVEESGWHWPWESSIVSQPKPQQADGFRWPWQDAQESVSEGFKTLTTGLTIVRILFLLALILWGIGIVRGAIGK